MEPKTTIQQGSKSFYFASRLMPSRYRPDVEYLYSLLREIDDIVDNSLQQGLSPDVVHSALDNVLHRDAVTIFFNAHKIPLEYLEELIEGCRSDLTTRYYQTFDDLYKYCYQVAGTVGIIMTYLFGETNKETLKYAEILGVAMQLTNILRDIDEDADRGIIYLPQEDLKRFHVTSEDIFNKRMTNSMVDLMKFEINRAWELYRHGSQGISHLPRDVRLSIKLAWYVYSGILRKIKQRGYNPYKGRVFVPLHEKITRSVIMLLANR